MVLKNAQILALLLTLFLGEPGSALGNEHLDQTREALMRAEETLTEMWDNGDLKAEDLSPVLVTEIQPWSDESAREFSTKLLALLGRSWRGVSVRVCQQCMGARVYQSGNLIDYSIGPPALSDAKRIDDSLRGDAPAARALLAVRETASGVSFELTSLATGRILLARHFTPDLVRERRTSENFTRSADLQRRMRGDSLTHSFVDYGVLGFSLGSSPIGVHLALDWMEQWGQQNSYMSGLSISLIGPVLGVGPTFALVVPSLLDTMFGGKILLSLPNALIATVSRSDVELFDPTVSLTGYARLPFGKSNYGLFLFGSTSGSVGVGLSTLNTSIIPVLP